jgi:CRISPR system Cascade subunit CasB
MKGQHVSTDTTTPAPGTQLTAVGALIDTRVRALQEGMLANRSAAVAALARLRRGAGKPVGTVSDILEHTMAAEFAPRGCGDEPTPAETAAHLALTLYATHQQAQSQRMHHRGHGVGRSIRRLLPDERAEQIHPVQRRFQALGASQDVNELARHLRGMVQLLRAKAIPLDYGLLADELLAWQRPGGPSRIRLRWGRDFYRTTPATSPQPADSPAR